MKKKYNMIDENLFDNKTLEVLYQLSKLKNLYRQGWLKRNVSEEIGESVADHSFSTAMTAWILAKHLNLQVDIEKVLKMSLVHEIGEIYAGDITPVDGISLEDKYQRELASVEKVFADYPQGQEFIDLWKEFEDAKSPEAKFLKQIDKFEMGLQASIYKKHDIGIMDEFLASGQKAQSDQELKKLYQEMIDNI